MFDFYDESRIDELEYRAEIYNEEKYSYEYNSSRELNEEGLSELLVSQEQEV